MGKALDGKGLGMIRRAFANFPPFYMKGREKVYRGLERKSVDNADVRPPAPGQPWTAPLVSRWLTEANDTIRRMHVRHIRPPAAGAYWPEFQGEVMDYAHDAAPSLGPPTRDAIDRLEICMGWMALVAGKKVRQSVLYISGGMSCRRVARKLQISRTLVDRYYRRGCSDIATKLNMAEKA